MFNILVVEDDNATSNLFKTVLEQNAYNVYIANNGKIAFDVLEKIHIDLIILDIMMPEMDGYTFMEEFRAFDSNTPIMMVSAKQMLDDKIRGFKLGVDDYMAKPVDIEEMLLRIQALLRRSRIASSKKLVVGNTLFDYESMSVTCNKKDIPLTKKEFQLVYLLLSYPNKIFTRLQLMDEIWGLDSDSTDTTINVHINRLRKSFENCNDFDLITIRGLGYKAVIKNE